METDEEIYLRYIESDDDADLEALLIRHREGLFLFLLGYVHNEEDAEDLLMDTFVKLAVDKPTFAPGRPGSFKSWLYTVARRTALARLRKRRVETVPVDENIPSDAELPETSLLKDERNRTLYRAMGTLNQEYRQALYLLYMENMSHEEIAGIMGKNIRQVYHLVDRGKQSLRKALERMGITDAQC